MHCGDVIMSAMASQITSLEIVYSTFGHKFGQKSKKTSKLRDTGLCVGNSPVTGEFPAQRDSNAENVSIWWLHHDKHYKSNVFHIRTHQWGDQMWYINREYLVQMHLWYNRPASLSRPQRQLSERWTGPPKSRQSVLKNRTRFKIHEAKH